MDYSRDRHSANGERNGGSVYLRWNSYYPDWFSRITDDNLSQNHAVRYLDKHKMITVETLEECAKWLPPERTNPAPGHVCLYTAPGGEHCIIGEICSRLGLEIPPSDHPDNKSAVAYLADPEKKNRWSGLFSPTAVVWAATAQLMG